MTPIPIGTLTRKIQCQLSVSVRIRRATPPIDPPARRPKPKTPIALARSDGSVTASRSAKRDRPRRRRRRGLHGARTTTSPARSRPHASEAAVRRDPGHEQPPVAEQVAEPAAEEEDPPKVSRYAFTTRASEVSEKPKVSRIEGSATPTIVTSRTIIRSLGQTMKCEPAVAGIHRHRVSAPSRSSEVEE